MAVNVKLGVDLGSFNSSINQAKAQIKSFDAALKYAESSFKATGDAEAAMTTKTQALNGKLQAQKNMVQQYSNALQQMVSAGIDPMSASYQKLQTQMLNAQASMMDTQAALNGLDGSQQQAANSADNLAKSVNSIGKKISLDQVIGGINRITDGLENAARKAVQLGEQIFSSVMDKARWADDTQTMALMYGIDLDTFLRMQKLVTNGMDTSVDAMLSAQSRLAKGIGSENKNAIQALRDMGVSLKTLEDTGNGILEFVDKNPQETFFEIGKALMEMDKAYDKEAAAQALFGRSWKELVPLFKEYKSLEEYNKALDGVTVSSEENVSELADLNDKIGELKGNLDTLSTDILATLAPALNAGAEALNGVLTTILEYLETDDGKDMLKQLGDSVAGLFGDLSKINPDDVVNNFVKVFDKLTEGLKWLSDNWSSVVTGIESIGVAFGLLKVSEGVLTFMKLASGVKGFFGSGTGGGIGLGAVGGLGAKLLATGGGVALTGATAALGGALAPYAGPLAAIPMAFEDQTMLGRTLRNGGSLGEAWAAEKDAVSQAAKNAGQAWLDWFDDIVNVPKELAQSVWKDLFGGGNAGDWSGEGGEDWSVKVHPEAEDGAAEDLSGQIGVVTVPVRLSVSGGGIGGGTFSYAMGNGLDGMLRNRYGFANGIPWVPDTQLAILHRGERVLTASENRNYTFNSNTYFGNVNLNNGTQVEQLAEAISRENRKQSKAYGS